MNPELQKDLDLANSLGALYPENYLQSNLPLHLLIAALVSTLITTLVAALVATLVSSLKVVITTSWIMAAGTMELKAFSKYVAVLAVFFAFPVAVYQYFLVLDCRAGHFLAGDDGVLRRGCRCIYLELLVDLLRSE